MPGPVTSTPAQNPAVARCIDAYERAYDAVVAAKKDRISARTAANDAYRKAMPPLTGAGNIRDFIACIAYGMLTNVILDFQGTKLLYAAQVAHASAHKPFKNSGSTSK